MTLFCPVVLFAGEDVMRLLYHGKEYEGQGQTVTVLALALLVSAVGLPASIRAGKHGASPSDRLGRFSRGCSDGGSRLVSDG